MNNNRILPTSIAEILSIKPLQFRTSRCGEQTAGFDRYARQFFFNASIHSTDGNPFVENSSVSSLLRIQAFARGITLLYDELHEADSTGSIRNRKIVVSKNRELRL